jgi:hypothetical protein
MNRSLQAIQQLLIQTVPESDSLAIVTPLESLPAPVQKEVSDTGLILSDFSMKAALEYFRAVREVLQFIAPEELSGWVGMGIPIAQHSSAAGIRYFREGSAIFSKISDPTTRKSFIQLGLSLAQQDPSLAVTYYQQAPSFLANVTHDRNTLREWAEYGFGLGDYTLAVEYFRTTPTLLQSMPISLLPDWTAVAKQLAASKLFFAITFIRTSPEVFSKVKADSAPLLRIIREIAATLPNMAFSIFKDSAKILDRIPDTIVPVFLEKASLLTIISIESAISLILNSPTLLKEVGTDSFLKWIEHGIRLLKTGAGKGYFTLESKASKEAANRLKGGGFLADYTTILTRFAHGLSGRPVKIKPLTDVDEKSTAPVTDGKVIYLPPYIDREQADQPFEWYKIATAFQAGYLEFGTFWPLQEEMEGLLTNLQKKYGQTTDENDFSLDAFLYLFPRRDIIESLFEIAEGARVEFFLRQEYPGLKSSLVRMREAELARWPHEAGLPPHQRVVDCLKQISLAGKTNAPIPAEFSSVVFEACRILGAVQDETATVVRSMKAAKTVYDLLEEKIMPPLPDVTNPMEAFEEKGKDEKVRGKGASSEEVRPSIRGKIYSNLTRTISKPSEDSISLTTASPSDTPGVMEVLSQPESGLTPVSTTADSEAGTPETPPASSSVPALPRFTYDEWDCEADDYRSGFCTVTEKEVTANGNDFTETVLSEYGGTIRSLKRTFQYLAPQGMVIQKGEWEGEQIDLDRLIENRIEALSGHSPSERIYTQPRKQERHVALACLIDMSGSTQQCLPSGKSVLQVEKEALVLLAHAIHAVGDSFALYGFSGRGNNAVDFYVLKDFKTDYARPVDLRIGAIEPLGQNRDGTAIRHAAFRLSTQIAQTRILILLSDGKPLDDLYTGSYAIADTKKALRETRQKGIHSFCITVDREGPVYLPGMYGDSAYLVIDRIEALPVMLPQIYKRLTT